MWSATAIRPEDRPPAISTISARERPLAPAIPSSLGTVLGTYLIVIIGTTVLEEINPSPKRSSSTTKHSCATEDRCFRYLDASGPARTEAGPTRSEKRKQNMRKSCALSQLVRVPSRIHHSVHVLGYREVDSKSGIILAMCFGDDCAMRSCAAIAAASSEFVL
jgi:hypothetical protein